MILKDDTVLDIVEQYLALDVPGTEAPTPDTLSPEPSPVPTEKPKGLFGLFGN